MLASKKRFHGHGSLRFVYARGQAVRTSGFVCKFTYNRRRNDARVAVVVSKKISKSAVKRNRIRRRMYEAVRNNIDLVQRPADIVFIVTSAELALVPFDELTLRVQGVLSRVSGVDEPVEK